MTEQEILRGYAAEWMELASLPVMDERKVLWGSLNAKRARRPMVLVETCLMTDYVAESELKCEDAYLRGVEKLMLENIRHAREVGDDFVLEPYFSLPWEFDKGSFGIEVSERVVPDSYGDTIGMAWGHPVQTSDDAEALHEREFSVDRKKTLGRAELLREMFDGILPVRVGGIDPVYGADGGYTPFAGLNITEITLNLFKLIGMNNIYLWPYDYPDEFHRLMEQLTRDFTRMIRYMEEQELLADNHNNVLTGGRYGYGTEEKRPISARDLWLWCTFEETTAISPEMYAEFILPYAKLATELFGKIYFGCCERLDRRYLNLVREIGNIEAVSVSPFTDLRELCGMLGDDVILSRKPNPTFLAGLVPDWENAKKDIRNTLDARSSPNLEFVMRDVYRTHGNRKVLTDWVEMARSQF